MTYLYVYILHINLTDSKIRGIYSCLHTYRHGRV